MSSEGDEDREAERIEMVDGIRITVKPAFDKNQRHEAARWECRVCSIHGECCKVGRSVNKNRIHFGRLAPRLFVGAWLEAAMEMSALEHTVFKPDVEQMQAYGEKHGIIAPHAQ